MAISFWDTRVRQRATTFHENRADFISNDKRFDEWVLVTVESGNFQYDTGQESGEAGFGDLVFAAPREKFWRQATTPLTYHVFQWSFVDAQGVIVEDAWQAGKWPVRDTQRLASTLGALKPLLGRGGTWNHRRVENLLEDLLHLAWATRSEPAPAPDPTMRHAAFLLQQRAGEVFSMREVSDAVGLKPVQFTRRFRAAYGQNPIEFLTGQRLEIACKLLIETDATIDEIAACCGWASGAYLSNVFTRVLRLTPGQFRHVHRI